MFNDSINNDNNICLLNSNEKLYQPFSNKSLNLSKNKYYNNNNTNLISHMDNCRNMMSNNSDCLKDNLAFLKNSNIVNLNEEKSFTYEELTDSDSNIISNPKLYKKNQSALPKSLSHEDFSKEKNENAKINSDESGSGSGAGALSNNLYNSISSSNESNIDEVTNKTNCSSFIGKIPSSFYIPRTYSLENVRGFHQNTPKIVPNDNEYYENNKLRQCNCNIS
tara:strand:- start:553 stop:1218 length:666 start_codon:yes stop_codon:yes gene_type:complete